jgi:hypothetical protein
LTRGDSISRPLAVGTSGESGDEAKATTTKPRLVKSSIIAL